MAQNMYPSNVDLDDPSPEVENMLTAALTQHRHEMFVTLFLIICCLFLYVLCNKDVESTSGSGPESFYTPEPSPTDRHSSSSGGLCSELLSIFEVLYVRPEGCNVKLGVTR